MTNQSGKAPFQADVHWASFKNVGEDTIPAYAVVAPDTNDEGGPKPWADIETGLMYYRLRLPKGGGEPTDPFSTDYDLFAINGPTDVAADKFGSCTFARHAPTWVLLDPEWQYNDERFEDVIEIGPHPGQNFMDEEGKGFALLHRKRLDPEADSPLIGLVIEKIKASETRHFKVTTPSVVLDAYSVNFGALTDDDDLPYVHGREVDPYTREFIEDEDNEEPEPTDLYPGSALRGWVCTDLTVMCIRGGPSGWLIVAGGMLDHIGYVVSTAGSTITVKLFEGGDGEVDVEATDRFDDGFSEDQEVAVKWEFDGPTRSYLRTYDFGCPSEPED